MHVIVVSQASTISILPCQSRANHLPILKMVGAAEWNVADPQDWCPKSISGPHQDPCNANS